MEGLKDHFKDQAEELQREAHILRIAGLIGYTLLLIMIIYQYV